MTVTLDTINIAAADLIERVGWTQKTERDVAGRVCLTGALRFCRPQPGDAHLAQEVYRLLGHGESWNDEPDRTAAEVVTYLREHPVTDNALATTFGPQWEAVVALVRRVAVLPADEVTVLCTAWDATQEAVRDAARDASRGAGEASRAAVWFAARNAAWYAERNAAWYAERYAAWFATQDAAIALAVRDLLLATPDGTAHYRTLTRPWATCVGPVHPDDDKD